MANSVSARPAAALSGCAVLPPIEPARPTGKAKGEAHGATGVPVGLKKGNRRQSRGGRFSLLNTFVDYCQASLSAAEVKVWLALFRDTKVATGTACTGQADLGRRAGVDPRTVRRALVRLESKGLLEVVRRGRLRKGASVYRVRCQPP